MSKYKGNRKLEDILANCKASGLSVDMSKFDAGSDWLTFEYKNADIEETLHVLYAPHNGKFMVERHNIFFTEEHSYMDNVPWYSDLLDLLYIEGK